MIRSARSVMAVIIGSVFTPMLALAQDSNGDTGSHKLTDFIFSVVPFIILAVLFWFFFRKQIRNQQTSPLVKRQQAYLDCHEQHMKRMEQLVERIAVALEKDRP